jgi:hypothetical protein
MLLLSMLLLQVLTWLQRLLVCFGQWGPGLQRLHRHVAAAAAAGPASVMFLRPAAGGSGCCCGRLLLLVVLARQQRQRRQQLQVWHLKLLAALLLLRCWSPS